MPQMAPMMWMSLMIFLIITLIIIMTMIYFLIQPTLSHKQLNYKTNSTNWKWKLIYSDNLILHLTS